MGKEPRKAAINPHGLRLTRTLDTRVIYCGDNVEVLKKIPDRCVDLVYIDPPFFSGRSYEVLWGENWERRAFEDRHESMPDYLRFMEERCLPLARVLRPSGTFYVHCDWHAAHYLKIMLDRVFGSSNFLNEIIWKRQSSHGDAAQGAKHFGRIHDTLLAYTGGGSDYTFNYQYRAYDRLYVDEHYRHIEPGTGRRYSLGDITAPGGATPSKGNPRYEFMGMTRYWRFSRKRIQELAAQGRIVQSGPGKVPRQKRYLDEARGVPLGTVWDDIQPVHGAGKERVGYPTQKPLALLERVIKVSSNPGDVVLDAFCGCGTTLEAAEMLDRRWIGIDRSPTACRVMADRLEKQCKIKQNEALWKLDRGFIVKGMPITVDELAKMDPFDFQNWVIIAIDGFPNQRKSRDMGIDGRLYPADDILRGKTGVPKAEQLEFTLDMFFPFCPIQTKQTEKVGRPAIDQFETAMRRVNADRGIFVAFGYTRDAIKEIDRFKRREGRTISPITVSEILEEQERLRAG